MNEIRSEKIGVTQKAFIFNDEGKVLIIKRTKTAPSKPSSWDLPGGKVDFGEDPSEAMRREIIEETGLEVENLRPFDTISKVDDDSEFWITIAYRAKAKTSEVKLSSEHGEYKWIALQEFPKHTDSGRFLKFLGNLK